MRPGDSLTFEGIPAGTTYEVKEAAGNYATSYEKASGSITQDKESESVILNRPLSTPTPEPTSTPEPTPTPPSQDDINKLPKTGDQTPYALTAAILLLSVSALLLIHKRKK
ncbi:MAG: LPXTG cell wall anchor domain-containing protein [Clostridia bacterium]|nr:LPXTG cell wall anchor domain-containing protein [Clostridia bacterium]